MKLVIVAALLLLMCGCGGSKGVPPIDECNEVTIHAHYNAAGTWLYNHDPTK